MAENVPHRLLPQPNGARARPPAALAGALAVALAAGLIALALLPGPALSQNGTVQGGTTQSGTTQDSPTQNSTAQDSTARDNTADAPDPVEAAVVEIVLTSQHGDWYSPWQAQRSQQASGSGFLIAPHLVMTNAHVVSDARQIVVQRSGQSGRFFAQIAYIGHDTDLALLKVDDPDFDRGVKPLELGDLPSLRSRVRTYGFPAGGDRISRTEGVVSRIQFITYLHTGVDNHLGVQTDSAINPGNSGGPVVQNGRVVGVAFQANTRLSGVGFFIPTPVIKRFMVDVQDGRYDGYVELGLSTTNLSNPMYREYLGLPKGQQGVVVDRVQPQSSCAGKVLPEDVILAIDGQAVRQDGTMDYHGYDVNYEQVAEEKQIGASVKLTLWRKRARMDVSIPLHGMPDAERVRSRFDVQPSYLIYAGLVFMPLDQEFLNTFGNYWQQADKQLLYAQFFDPVEHSAQPAAGTLVLSRVLPATVNRGYRSLANTLLAKVNGAPVHTLTDLDKALAASQGPYDRFVLVPGDVEVVIERAEALRTASELLAQYGITKDRRLP